MKVVGGPCDGIDVMIKDGWDLIQLIDPLQYSYQYGPTSKILDEPVRVSYINYTVRRIFFAGDRGEPPRRLLFLAPSDWSDERATHYQFKK